MVHEGHDTHTYNYMDIVTWSTDRSSDHSVDASKQWCSTRLRWCTRVGLESIFVRTRTRVLDSDAKDSDSDSSPQSSDSTHYRPAVTYYFLHWDTMFKKIQWTFSIHFLNSNYLVSLQYQCLFLWPGTVGTVSGSVKATHITNWHWSNCSMQGEQVFRSGETFMWPHRAGVSNKLELWFSLP